MHRKAQQLSPGSKPHRPRPADRKGHRPASDDNPSEPKGKLLGFSSRGYTKLSNIITFLNYNLRDKVVLDIGSSTGGFTACALDRGAKRVIAIEKGTNQMARPLRYDPRIDLREKTDIFTIQRTTLPHINLVVADVSFVSLRPILLHAKRHLASPDTEFLVMLKPQFEAAPSQLTKGVIKNEKIRRLIIKDFELWLRQNDFIIKAKRDNLHPGKTGNLERFYYLTQTSRPQTLAK